TPEMYLGSDGHIARELTNTGYLAPGVPGTVRGLELAHRRFGKLPWKDVVMPAVRLAEDGFLLPAGLARALNTQGAGEMQPFAAAEFRRRRTRRDAEHPRALRPEVEGPADRAGSSPRDRSDAPCVSGSRAQSRRSGFRQGAGRRADLETARARGGRDHRPCEGV